MKKIAIVRLSALGDIINTTVVLQFIKKKYPYIKIDWICEEAFAPIISDHPLIHRVHTISLKRLKKEKSISYLIETISKLRNLGEFDLIIDMQGLIKSAVVARFIGKNVFGYDKNSVREKLASIFYKNTTSMDYGENVIKRNINLISKALNIDITDRDILNKEPSLSSHKLHSNQIVFVIGASWESKKYPRDSFVQLANLLKEKILILWGDESEFQDALYIAEHSKYVHISEKFSLLELRDVIACAKIVIGNDTGPTHLAWALNVPSVTLFGPTNERMIYETAINCAIHSPSSVDIYHIDKKDFSIKEIDPTLIFNQIQEIV